MYCGIDVGDFWIHHCQRQTMTSLSIGSLLSSKLFYNVLFGALLISDLFCFLAFVQRGKSFSFLIALA